MATAPVEPQQTPAGFVATVEDRTRVAIVYPADPPGSIPGGIDTFIRGLIRWAPADIDMNLIGVTTDAKRRRVGVWTRCVLGPSSYQHYSVYEIENPGRQPRIPATVRFMATMVPRLPRFYGCFDVLEFHRLEPLALFVRDPTPKTVVLHQNMDAIRSSASDIRWKHVPGLYFRLERTLLRRASSAFFVREDAVAAYRQRYPDIADRFRFTPTWMDPEVFHPLPPDRVAEARAWLRQQIGAGDTERVLISVGRLDRQKDPLLLCSAFAELCRTRTDLRLVFVGDGVLRAETEALLRTLGVIDRVTFTGLQPAAAVARYLNASDLFVLASAYEGMPMSVLEALGCGVPVCSTDVGEVRRSVVSGVNGQIVQERTPQALARACGICLDELHSYRGAPALDAALPFVAERILAPFYANYRRLARSAA